MTSNTERAPTPLPEGSAGASLRARAEAIARERALRAPLADDLPADSLRRMLADARVREVELELQNDALRAAQETLDAARDEIGRAHV